MCWMLETHLDVRVHLQGAHGPAGKAGRQQGDTEVAHKTQA